MKPTLLTLLTLICFSLCATAQIQTQHAQLALLEETGVFGVSQRGGLQQVPGAGCNLQLHPPIPINF